MNIKANLLLVVLVLSSYAAALAQKEFPSSVSVKVTNALDAPRTDAFVFIPLAELKKKAADFNPNAFIILDQGKEIASQYNAKDKDLNGVVAVLASMKAKEVRELQVRYNPTGEDHHTYPKLTQAELSHKTGGTWENRKYIGGTAFQNVEALRVPKEHKDHSYFIRYEGPGWESDKVGYRFYLDQRNATDVFGKKDPAMVLQQVGQDGFDSYHKMQPWGMDVMKVEKSLGLGSIGSLQNGAAVRVELTDSVSCAITANGSVYSSIATTYYGWKVGDKKHTMQSRLNIHSGTRVTQEFLTVSNGIDNICTGIVKDKAAALISSKGDDKHFGYLATYGKQSLNGDELGLAVFFKPGAVISLTEDPYSHIVTLKPSDGKVEYYFLAAWVLEPEGIKDESHFKEYLQTVSQELASPLKVMVGRSGK